MFSQDALVGVKCIMKARVALQPRKTYFLTVCACSVVVANDMDLSCLSARERLI